MLSDPSGIRRPTRSELSSCEASSSAVQASSYMASDCIRLIFQLASLRDLHNLRRVSKPFKTIADTEQQNRSGLVFKKMPGIDSPISEIRLFFDANSRINIEVKSHRLKLPLLLPIKDNTPFDGIETNQFEFFDNRLHIAFIQVPIKYEKKPLEIYVTRTVSEKKTEDEELKTPILLEYKPSIEGDVRPQDLEQRKLMDAIKNNHTQIVAEQLARGVSANTRDDEGIPLLVLAASYGDLENVKLLVAHRAHLEAKSLKADQLNALLTAAQCINLSEKKSENKSDSPSESQSIMHENKHKAVLMFLIKKDARIDSVSKTGKNLLHYLVAKNINNKAEISSLVARGMNPFQVDVLGRRPVDYADTRKYPTQNASLLYCATMHSDPTLYMSHWLYQEETLTYAVYFNSDVWTIQKINAFEAISNKLKSLTVSDPSYVITKLGLSSDFATTTYFEGRGGQVADVKVPQCAAYAIADIICQGDRRFISIKLRAKFKSNPYVHESIQQTLNFLLPLKSGEQKRSEPSVYAGTLTHFKQAPKAQTVYSSQPKMEEKPDRRKCVIL